jgi:hypothetical protein
MNKSIVTIDSPQFINLQPLDINPLMSECEIKVLYLGENRNGSYIDKETATKMSKTLRGAPIVGYWKKDAEDFADHGNQIIIDDEGVKFKCLTVPYGFVAPDAKVWFQTFEDTDDFGNTSVREYLMTTGFLWTGQFEECKVAVEEGRPHSMELDEETLDGHWANNPKNGMDFFIINDAVFSKLCVLGENVEPCFEGSSVTAPKVSLSFTKSVDDGFKKTLFNMMQDLQFALQGGQQMENEVIETVETTEEVATDFTEETDVATSDTNVTEEVVEPTVEEPVVEETTPAVEDSFAKKEDEEEKSEEEKEEASNDDTDKDDKGSNDNDEGDQKNSDASDDDEEDKKKKYELLEAEYTNLQNEHTELLNKFEKLTSEYNELLAFKASVEDAEKDAMIAKFSYLSEEDKKDVIENKSKYSVEDIESKLSVICVRKKINFNLEEDSTLEHSEQITTYNLNNLSSGVPAWVNAVKNNNK